MKAAILREFKAPLSIEDVAQPCPDAHEVLIEVEACGVCHSDLHVADGDWPQFVPITKRPLILGHEIAGRVVEKGASVHLLEVGDRVGVPWVYWTCGECDFCREGNENLCAKQKITGVTVDGGYAEFVKVPASHATKIPDGLSSIDAAPLFCAGVTVYRALKHAKIQPGQRLAVFGVGGLGHLAVQIGVGLGAIVTAVDVSDEKLAHAKSLGASTTLNSDNRKCRQRIAASGRSSCCAGYLGREKGVRHGVSMRQANWDAPRGWPAFRVTLLPAHHDGGNGSAHPGFFCRHTGGLAGSPGLGRGGKSPMPDG